MPDPVIPIPMDRLKAFCEKWMITEFSLFGSVLREDFGPNSDVDCCVVFDPANEWSLFDIVTMREELSELFGGREVDMVERKAIVNPFRRHHILTHRRIMYAA